MRTAGLGNIENKKRLFWISQFLFWFAHIVRSTVNNPDIFNDFLLITLMLLSILAGFLLTMCLRWFYKKFRCYYFPPVALIAVILLYSIFTGIVWSLVNHLNYYCLYQQSIFTKPQMSMLQFFILIWNNTYLFVVWSAFYLGFKIYEEWFLQKQNTERAEALVKSAQLEMLKYQLNPHFLFNSLSSLRALTRTNAVKAEEMITQISEFLKYSLLEGKHNEVSLAKEIEIVKHYLNIEKVRFGDKLLIDYNIEPMAEVYPIPIFLLHPIIENAVKHGMESSTLPLKITVNAEVIDDSLHIDILNTGKWIEPSSKNHLRGTGTGLENTKKRLENSYPGNHYFEIIKGIDTVLIKIKMKKDFLINNDEKIYGGDN